MGELFEGVFRDPQQPNPLTNFVARVQELLDKEHTHVTVELGGQEAITKDAIVVKQYGVVIADMGWDEVYEASSDDAAIYRLVGRFEQAVKGRELSESDNPWLEGQTAADNKVVDRTSTYFVTGGRSDELIRQKSKKLMVKLPGAVIHLRDNGDLRLRFDVAAYKSVTDETLSVSGHTTATLTSFLTDEDLEKLKDYCSAKLAVRHDNNTGRPLSKGAVEVVAPEQEKKTAMGELEKARGLKSEQPKATKPKTTKKPAAKKKK